MSGNESGQEKTEEATPKRKQDAKDKGQVARSRELNTTVLLMFGAVSMIFFGQHTLEGIADIINTTYQFEHKYIFDNQYIVTVALTVLNKTIVILLPILFILLIGSVIGPVMLSGWSISAKAMAPKFERLNPLKGLKRIFAIKGLVELGKAILKFLVVASISLTIMWFQLPTMLNLGSTQSLTEIYDGLTFLAWIFLAISSSMIIIAAIDVPYQIWDHMKQIKMTKQEIRDEYKETEGKPEVKSAIRRAQQEMANARMMSEVPKADVVITNPTHYAVALRYDQDKSGAPRVVAKGKDLVAFRIRDIAKQADVTVISSPPLARAVFFSTKLNHEIPHGLYVAVAQVLAYVYQLKRHKGKARKLPDIEVPDEYRF